VSCSSAEVLFEGYLDNVLTPAQRARLLSHLGGCGSCKGILDELRVVDALLVSPRVVELPQNFTFATMAEVRSMPRPHVTHAPVLAYLVSFLAAAWLLIGAGFLLASSTMRTIGESALGLSAEIARSLGAVGHAGLHLAGDLGGLGTWFGAAAAIDAAAVLIVGIALIRPRLADRIRS
jgi:hypothetical protein